jgi:hypothetical protein
MNIRSISPGIAVLVSLLAPYVPSPVCSAASASPTTTTIQAKQADKRKLTTIQTAKSGPVEVQYLDLPFGVATFGYLEKGGDEYYSNRSWPFAHLRLSSEATYAGKTLVPGDYVLYITPKSSTAEMMLSVAWFKPATPGGTFLVPGNVFVETPADVKVIASTPVRFQTSGPANDHLTIGLENSGKNVAINVRYGDRIHTETIALK